MSHTIKILSPEDCFVGKLVKFTDDRDFAGTLLPERVERTGVIDNITGDGIGIWVDDKRLGAGGYQVYIKYEQFKQMLMQGRAGRQTREG